MSSTPKIAAITAASIGVVLAQSSSLRAENEGSSAPERATKIAAPIDWDEEVLYSALPDEVLEKAAGLGGTMHLAAGSAAYMTCTCPPTCSPQSAKKPTFGGVKYEDRKVPPKGSTGLTVPPKPTQDNAHK